MKASDVKDMREALNKIYFNAQYICEYRDEPAIVHHRANLIERAVNAALSKPPRNCDVGTASQQAQRFAELCTSHSKDGARGICDEKCQFYGKEYGSDCALVWAQMPYETNEKGN